MMKEESKAKTNAFTIIIYLPVTKPAPKMMASVAPKLAAEAIPRV